MEELCKRMAETLRRRNYSEDTVRNYTWQVKAFGRMFGRAGEELGEGEVQQYIESLVAKQRSGASVRLFYSAAKFLYHETLGREWKLQSPPPVRKEKRLPLVLSVEEIEEILGAIANVQQRVLLMTTYGGGLRIREAVKLKVTDIESKRMLIRVEQGKGKKDRYTILPQAVLEELRTYWRMWRPQDWLFPGSRRGKPVSVRTAQRTFEVAKKKWVLRSG
jgi:integrase/recombinase XerD